MLFADREKEQGVEELFFAGSTLDIRMSVLLLTAVLIMLAVGAVSLICNYEKQSALLNAEKIIINQSISFAEDLNRFITTADELLLFGKQEYEHNGNHQELDYGSLFTGDLLHLYKNGTSRIFQEMILINQVGQAMASTEEFTGLPNLAEREYFKFHLRNNNNQLFIGKPIIGLLTKKNLIPLSRRLNNADGSFGGVILMTFDPEQFSRTYWKLQLAQSQRISLSDTNGNILIDWPDDKKNETGEIIRSVHVFPNYPLILTVSASQEEMLQNFYDRKRIYWLTTALFIFFISFVCFFILRQIHQQNKLQCLMREGKTRYRDLFYKSPVVVIIVDPFNGKIVNANIAAASYYGYSLAELCQLMLGDINMLSQDENERNFQLIVKEEKRVHQVNHRLANGEVRNVEVFSCLIKLAGRIVIYAIINDITAKVTAEKALQISEKRWLFFLEGSQQGVWERDMVKNETYSSPWAKKMLGYEVDSLINSNEWSEKHIHPADFARVSEAMEAYLSGEKPFYLCEYRMLTKTGKYCWILSRGKIIEWDEKGRPLRMIGTHVDVSENKRLLAEVQEVNERYRALVQNSAEAIVLYDVTEKRFVEANPRFYAMTGYETKDLASLNLDMLLFSTVAAKNKIVHGYLYSGSGSIVRLLRKDGRLLMVEQSFSLVRHQEHSLQLYNFRDITEQRKLQAQIQEEVELAGDMQKSMLPRDMGNELAAVRTIFHPYHMVSGDYLGYSWVSNTVLRGFLVDVTGHGMATALYTSILVALLNERIRAEAKITTDFFRRLNTQVIRYFSLETFAAILCFEIDFNTGQLTYGTGGINYFLASSNQLSGRIKSPGSYIGMLEEPEVTVVTVSVKPGDAFYFVSDGIDDQLAYSDLSSRNFSDFDNTVHFLRQLSEGSNCRDDASALCIQIRSVAFVL